MGAAIGQTLGTAVGVAISPVPMIALILMLFSAAAARNSVAFLLGWLVGLTGVGLVVLALDLEGANGESDGGGVLKLIVGALLLVLAVRQWRSRPAPGAEPELPAWMSAVDDLSAVKAFGMGVVLTAANPKNLGLTVVAATTIGATAGSNGAQIASLVVFVLIASVTIIVPVVAYLAAADRVEPTLTAAKAWLMANNATVMSVLFVVLGAKVLGDGLAILS